MKKLLSTFVLLSGAAAAHAQALPDRYRADITTAVSTTSGVQFSTNVPQVSTTGLFGAQLANEQTYGAVRLNLKMDIYQPQGDTLSKRPVIIFCFGGGFVNGSRTAADMVALARAFARRGFVTASIDYRLGMNLTDPEKAKRAVYRAIQDSRSAVRFFRNNARAYRVDPNQVYVSGHSAGGFVAYHNVYLDREAERPASTFANSRLRQADLGTLDAVGDNQTDAQGNRVSGKANAAMGFAGALADVTNIEGPADVPVVLFHSSDDNTVPYTSGEPFSFLNFVPGINLPTVYGSQPLDARAAAVGASHVFYAYPNRGHNVHFNGSALYPDIAPRGGQFFYDYRLKPAPVGLTGNAAVCRNQLTETYTAPAGLGYYDWQATGGTIVQRNPRRNAVTVTWSASAATRTLTLTPYSPQLAQGAPVALNVTLTTCASRAADLLAGSNLYPNPTTGLLTVQLPATGELAGPVSLKVLDKFGNVALAAQIEAGANFEQTLDLSALPAGVYFLQIGSAESVATRQVVKE